MPEAGNPFIPGQPVDDPSLFYGRRTATAWIRENLVKGQRLLLVSGSPRIGKTSLLVQVPRYLPDIYTPVRVELLDEEVSQLDRLLWRLADVIAQDLGHQLRLNLPRPAWNDFEAHTEHLVEAFWPQVRAVLGGVHLLLMLDDVDSLIRDGSDLLSPLLSVIQVWCKHDPRLALILTATLSPQELDRIASSAAVAAGRLPILTMVPLAGDEASRLMTEPVEGVLTYDYGVVRRLVEITSGQPYYLQLLGFEIYNRCATAGWVNQRDVDVVVEQLVGREIVDFREVWDGSSPQEQAVLAALVSLRVSRGVATPIEVHTQLINSGARVDREQVVDVLAQLAGRGILERLGAGSYRFRVILLADWLRERVDLARLARSVRWARERDRDRAAPPPPAVRAVPTPPESEATAEPAGPASRARPRRLWLWLGPAALLVTALVGIVWLALLWKPSPGVVPGRTAVPGASPPAPTAQSSARQTPTRAPDAALPTAGPSDTPTPAASPTPSPPVVVSRPLPAIAYQSHPDGSDTWSIYVMNSDGSHPERLTDGTTKSMTPTWSPDGRRLAFVSDQDGNADIWVMGLDGSGLTNLTHHPAQDQWPAWSPDGEWIAFASVRDAPYWELYVMRADGSDVRRLTFWDNASDLAPTWSPDGSRIAFTSKRDGNWELYAVDRDGQSLVRLTDDPADDTNPAWSPDGSRIAFESTRTGYADVFVMPAAGGAATNLTNQRFASDHGPTWSPDGGRIAFFSDRAGEWDIYVMAADGSSTIKLTGEGTDDQVPAWRP